MDKTTMMKRTREFAKQVIMFCRRLPRTREGMMIGDQLFRAGTSVGANYRSACRARSRAEFISKISIVLEEADESLYWFELIDDCRITAGQELFTLKQEANELVSIFVVGLISTKSGKIEL
jgi:four helix bundle protein